MKTSGNSRHWGRFRRLHEGNQWKLLRLWDASGDLRETSTDSRHWVRLVETPDTGLGETSRDSRHCGRLVETPEAGGDLWRL